MYAVRQVSKFARVLKKHGVKRGDRVLIYMPMVPEAIVAMLASSRVGALHSLVFGGFGSKELATRICHADVSVYFFFFSFLVSIIISLAVFQTIFFFIFFVFVVGLFVTIKSVGQCFKTIF